MNNVNLENLLISVDIVDLLQDYVGIQLDIDSTKVKAAAMVAQKIDLKRTIGTDNVTRCREPQNEADEALRDLVIPAWCYYTYSRSLKMFNGTLTDSGYVLSEDAEKAQSAAKKTAESHYSVAEVFIIEAIDFINAESTTDEDIDEGVLTPKIRVFGGQENRASN